MADLIDRHSAIDAIADYIHNVDKVMGSGNLSGDDCKDAAQSVLEEVPSAQPDLQQTCNKLATDCISRRDAVSRFSDLLMLELKGKRLPTWEEVYNAMQDVPSAQPKITDDMAIKHLCLTGWMQNHDKEMYEMGLRERLADDSDSYDSLIPSVEPERNNGKWEMFDLITSVYYGKMMYFKQDNGIIYSRYSGKYMRMDEAINEFLALIGG